MKSGIPALGKTAETAPKTGKARRIRQRRMKQKPGEISYSHYTLFRSIHTPGRKPRSCPCLGAGPLRILFRKRPGLLLLIPGGLSQLQSFVQGGGEAHLGMLGGKG